MAVVTQNLINAYLRVFGDYNNSPQARSEAFWISHKMIFGGTEKELHRNPWAEWMILRLCEHKYLGMSGCTTSGKSTVTAIYALQMWWSKPKKTKIMVTSTDKQGARNRVWSHFREGLLVGIQRRGMPGKLVDSVGSIVLDLEEGAVSSRSGIELFAGEPKKSKDCIQKWVGIHNERLILVLDEMAFLGPQLLEAAYSNLAANPHFQLVGVCNFSSKLDPFGDFVNPKNGWESIDIDCEEWETICNGQKGFCIHLDGSKSPNVIAGENLYPDIYSVETFEKHRALGEQNPRFWSMCRSWPAPIGIGNSIYSESHFSTAFGPEPIWMKMPIPVAALDPAFTNGGDRTQMVAGKYGQTQEGFMLYLNHYEELYADASKTAETRDYQIARIFRDRCKSLGVLPENAGVDKTGAGSSFHEIVQHEWNYRVQGIMFGGAASDRPAHENDNKPGRDVYFNRVAELWDQGKEYFVKGMIRGVRKQLARELCAREYDRLGQAKIKIESKDKMKLRIGCSPDESDAALMVLEVCRINFGFYPQGTAIAGPSVDMKLGDGGYHAGLVAMWDLGYKEPDVSEPARARLSPIEAAKSLVGWQVDDLYGGDGGDFGGLFDLRTGT